jgi:hypothetical protein
MFKVDGVNRPVFQSQRDNSPSEFKTRTIRRREGEMAGICYLPVKDASPQSFASLGGSSLSIALLESLRQCLPVLHSKSGGLAARMAHGNRLRPVLSGTAAALKLRLATAGFCFWRTPPPKQVRVPAPQKAALALGAARLAGFAGCAPKERGGNGENAMNPNETVQFPRSPRRLNTVAQGDCVELMRQMPTLLVGLKA